MRAAIALALLTTAGCIHTVRGSSAEFLPEAESQRSLPQPPEQVAREISDLLGRRGFHLVDRRATSEAVFLRFKGTRSVSTVVGGYISRGSGAVSGWSDEIGSVFDVTLAPRAEGTQLWLAGRPTVQGRISCTPPTPFPCDGYVTVPGNSPGVELVSGRDEAEAIRGVLIELGGIGARPEAAAAPVAAASAAAPRPPVGPPSPTFVPARVRAGAALRTAPDAAAPVKEILAEVAEGLAEPEAGRGFRRVRLSDGRSGLAPEGAVELLPQAPPAAP